MHLLNILTSSESNAQAVIHKVQLRDQLANPFKKISNGKSQISSGVASGIEIRKIIINKTNNYKYWKNSGRKSFYVYNFITRLGNLVGHYKTTTSAILISIQFVFTAFCLKVNRPTNLLKACNHRLDLNPQKLKYKRHSNLCKKFWGHNPLISFYKLYNFISNVTGLKLKLSHAINNKAVKCQNGNQIKVYI